MQQALAQSLPRCGGRRAVRFRVCCRLTDTSLQEEVVAVLIQVRATLFLAVQCSGLTRRALCSRWLGGQPGGLIILRTWLFGGLWLVGGL